ncbi:hypothetical protein BDW74DRAFT_180794 [Aspergillus multicolor]|uniref:uncharacterized protein n=1 Tax=Aspergillus multicolor TaxID=41759 RepID=UPI003CCE1664
MRLLALLPVFAAVAVAAVLPSFPTPKANLKQRQSDPHPACVELDIGSQCRDP